jgi:hypothetical protein
MGIFPWVAWAAYLFVKRIRCPSRSGPVRTTLRPTSTWGGAINRCAIGALPPQTTAIAIDGGWTNQGDTDSRRCLMQLTLVRDEFGDDRGLDEEFPPTAPRSTTHGC